MVGVGEASAIVGLTTTATQLSKAFLEIASKYKDAGKEIEWLGQEVSIFGEVLGQMHHLLGTDLLGQDVEFCSVLAKTVNRCGELFSELEVYKFSLYIRQGSVRNLSFRERMKLVFEATKADYLRARLESEKANMQLMMYIHHVHSLDSDARDCSTDPFTLAERLERLEEELASSASEDGIPAIGRMSFMTTDRAMSARSMRWSIMSLYSHQSYSTLSTRASNRTQLAYSPEFTNGASESTSATQATITGQPLVSLPGEPSSVIRDQVPEESYPYRATARYSFLASPGGPANVRELSHKKYEPLQIKEPVGPWWVAENQVGERGLVANNYMILL